MERDLMESLMKEDDFSIFFWETLGHILYKPYISLYILYIFNNVFSSL